MRPSTLALGGFFLAVVAVAGSFVHAGLASRSAQPRLSASADLVRQWGLTDLSLFTEARYTRHPSQADRHAALQDHPFALEHFPSGALMMPPPAVKAPFSASPFAVKDQP